MKIKEEIQVINSINDQKEVKELTNFFKSKSLIQNNRKTTKGRRRQKILFAVKNSFPPIYKIKYIIH